MRKVSLKTIERRIEALKLQAEKIKRSDKTPALRAIAALMKKHDISLQDLGGGRRGGPAGTGKRPGRPKGYKVKPIYRNPKTGETWSGRGRTARWLMEAEKVGQKRAMFLMKKA